MVISFTYAKGDSTTSISVNSIDDELSNEQISSVLDSFCCLIYEEIYGSDLEDRVMPNPTPDCVS